MGASGAPGRLRAAPSHVSHSDGSSTSISTTSSAAPAPPPPCREPQQARIRATTPWATPGGIISSAEAEAFKRQGLLLKHGLLGHLEPLRRWLWSPAPPMLRRGDRETWVVDPQGPGTTQRGPEATRGPTRVASYVHAFQLEHILYV